MSGVGSTNAMKKGSANNPFLANSEADMQSFLNSAYTGCIVKYTGPSTKKGIQDVLPLDSAKSLGDAQNLVVNLYWAINNDSDYGEVAHPAGGTIRENPWHITVVNKTTGKTQYIQEVKVDTTNKKFVDTSKSGGLAWLLSDWYLSSLDDSLSFQDSLTKNVTVLECENDKSKSGYDLLTYWPLERGWQKSCFNTEGKILLWGYGDTVELSCPIVYYYNRGPFWVEPYVVNKLYKVVYGDGQYYFEEFYYISEDVTTAIVEDVAPGKTFYDFTGTKQTGTGTKINPYIAQDLDTFKSFPIGSFIKWLGPNKTVLDETTGQMLIQNEIYRAVEDGDVFQYVILPTLSNPGTATDLAQGKQLIDGEGKVVEGEAVNPEGKLAMDLFAKTITDINDTQGSITSWPALYYTNQSFRAPFCTNCKQLSRVNLPNLSSSSEAIIPSMAFYGCTNLKYVDIGYFNRIYSSAFIGCTHLREIKGLENVTYIASSAFVNAKFVQDDEFVLPKFSKLTNIDAYYVFSGAELFDITDETFPALTYISGYSTFYNTTNITKLSLTNLETLSGYYTFEYCQNLQEINCPKLLRIFGQDCFGGCRKLSSVNMPAISFIGSGAFRGCSAIKDISLPAVTTLSEYAFRYCSFSKIVLPSLSKMNGDPFRDCRALISVYLPNSVVCSVAGGIFNYTPMRSLYSEAGYKYGSIYVPMSLLSQYQSASYWSNLSARMVGLTDEEFASALT